MPLNDMDQPALERLIDVLNKVGEVTQALHRDGLDPRIDLTPGLPIQITIDAAMPDHEDLADRAKYLDRQIAERFPKSTEAAQPEPAADPAPAPVDPSPALGEVAGDEDISAEPSRSIEVDTPKVAEVEVPAESGGGSVMAAAEPPAAPSASADAPAPVPGSASALASSAAKYGPWTDGEDSRLIQIIARLMTQQGLTKKAAIAAATQELGRPEAGTAWRCRNKLADRIDAALAKAAMDQAQTETPDLDPLTPEDKARIDAAWEKHKAAEPVAAPAIPEDAPSDLDARSREAAIAHGNGPDADPLQAHIDSLPRKDGWTLERDAEFLELKGLGWKENEIALEMTVQARLLRPRLDLLTGAYQDDKGKLQRRFGETAVLAAIQARLLARAS